MGRIVTARIPVSPGVHGELKRVKRDSGAQTFDALLKEMLAAYDGSQTEDNA